VDLPPDRAAASGDDLHLGAGEGRAADVRVRAGQLYQFLHRADLLEHADPNRINVAAGHRAGTAARISDRLLHCQDRRQPHPWGAVSDVLDPAVGQ